MVQCFVIGGIFSERVPIQVHYSPNHTAIAGPNLAGSVLTLFEFSTSMVTITVEASPQATNTLIKLDETSPSACITFTDNGIMFGRVNRADAGRYNFTSTNIINPSAITQITLVVMPVNCIPRDPQILLVEELGGGRVRVLVQTLASGIQPGESIYFILSYTDINSPSVIMQSNMSVADYMDGDVVSFSIDDLTAGASYSFSVQAGNELGTSGTTAGDMPVTIIDSDTSTLPPITCTCNEVTMGSTTTGSSTMDSSTTDSSTTDSSTTDSSTMDSSTMGSSTTDSSTTGSSTTDSSTTGSSTTGSSTTDSSTTDSSTTGSGSSTTGSSTTDSSTTDSSITGSSTIGSSTIGSAMGSAMAISISISVLVTFPLALVIGFLLGVLVTRCLAKSKNANVVSCNIEEKHQAFAPSVRYDITGSSTTGSSTTGSSTTGLSTTGLSTIGSSMQTHQ